MKFEKFWSPCERDEYMHPHEEHKPNNSQNLSCFLYWICLCESLLSLYSFLITIFIVRSFLLWSKTLWYSYCFYYFFLSTIQSGIWGEYCSMQNKEQYRVCDNFTIHTILKSSGTIQGSSSKQSIEWSFCFPSHHSIFDSGCSGGFSSSKYPLGPKDERIIIVFLCVPGCLGGEFGIPHVMM